MVRERTVCRMSQGTESPWGSGLTRTRLVLAAGTSVLLSAGAAAQGSASVEGHYYRATLAADTPVGPNYPNGGNAFVRGVDIWEDGLIWSVSGLGAPVGGTLEQSTTARMNIWTAMPSGNQLYLNESQDLGVLFGSLGLSASNIWPTDLTCDDPSSVFCGATVSNAVSVGGFKCSAAADQFMRGGEFVPIPSSACGNAGNAWLWSITWNRANVFGVNPYVDGQWGGAGPYHNNLVTFIAGAGGGVPFGNAYVRSNSVDSTYRFSIVCENPSATTPYLGYRLVSGGSFKGTGYFKQSGLTFPNPTGQNAISFTTLGGEDAYLAVHAGTAQLPDYSPGTNDPPVLRPGSTGDDAILGVSINHRTQEIVVCGYFGAANLDFDPGAAVKNLAHSGGRDLFVASYNYSGSQIWSLNWAYSWSQNSSGNEQAEGVWSDVSGATFVTGWKDEANGGDLVVFRLDPPSCVIPCFTPNLLWSKTIAGTSRARGFDICVDGLGRPIVTGDFNGTITFPANYNGNTSIALTAGVGVGDIPNATDAFTARFDRDDGNAEWAYDTGGTDSDTGADVAVCQFNSARLVHGGDFRTTVDFNPGTGISTLSATNTDGFINALEHQPELNQSGVGAKHHISLVLDKAVDNRADGVVTNTTRDDWLSQIGSVETQLNSPGYAWLDGRASLQVVLANTQGFELRNPSDQSIQTYSRAQAMQVVPITTVRSNKEAKWVAERLHGLDWDRPHTLPPSNGQKWDYRTFNHVMQHVGDYFRSDTNAIFVHPDHATYRHVLFPLSYEYSGVVEGDGWLLDDALRVELTSYNNQNANPILDQINAIAVDFGPGTVGRVNRNDLLGIGPGGVPTNTQMVESHRQQPNPPDPTEKHIAFAPASEYHATNNPFPWTGSRMADLVKYSFMRMAACPSDFNRDGATNVTDSSAFATAYQNLADPLHGYADWNFDKDQPAGGWQVSSPDGSKFDAGFSPLTGCPN